MAKATVIKAFRDRENMESAYEAGDTFEGSDERVASLAYRGFVEPVKAEGKPKRAPRKKAKG